jgi:hypothetical protein
VARPSRAIPTSRRRRGSTAWTPESLSLYLLNNEGEEKCLVFSPLAGKGLVFAVRVVLTPGAIGGAIGSYGTASVTLPVRGRPRYAATGPAALALLADED